MPTVYACVVAQIVVFFHNWTLIRLGVFLLSLHVLVRTCLNLSMLVDG